MSSSIQIWNQAMMKIGADRITIADLDPESSVEAQLAETIYETEKRAFLRGYVWNCAIKRATLALEGNPPANQFAYAYALPSDSLRLLEVRVGDYRLANFNGTGVPAYVVEGKSVLTNEQNVTAKYIANIDESLFDAYLEEAFIAKLSFESVFALGQSASAMANFGQIYEGKLNEARIANQLENPHVVTRTDALDLVRW